jgi:hypothetical protein
MSEIINQQGAVLADKSRRQANNSVNALLQDAIRQGKQGLVDLRRKLSFTYWLILGLSAVIFSLGVVLLSVPVAAAWKGNINLLTSVIAAGFGIADLGVLYLFRPIERIQELMGDMSQITMVINSFQTQVSLRLQEMDLDDPRSVSRAAKYIQQLSEECARQIETYFEESNQAQTE